MRKSAVVLIAAFSITACGSPPPSATPPAQHVIISSPAPAPLVDPVGLVTVAPPTTSVCELVGKNSFDVSATADGPALFHLAAGDAKLTIGSQGELFVVATTPSFTVQGFVAHDSTDEKMRIYPAKWLSFGGVYFPGVNDAMTFSVHDGKISINAVSDLGFHFAGTNGTLDVACDDVALAADRNGVLRTTLPPPFEKSDGKLSVLNYTKSVSLSADADGSAMGTFDVHDGPATVTVIERKGKKAHIRTGHVIGWVDASALKAFTPATRKSIDALGGTAMLSVLTGNGGAVNLVGGSDPSAPSPSPPISIYMTIQCLQDIRVLALSSSVPYVVGTIPAEKPVHLSSRGDFISTIALDDDRQNPSVIPMSSARFAVPNKDLVNCELVKYTPPVVRKGNDDATPTGGDAIDALPAETPKKIPPRPRVQQESAEAMGVLLVDVVALRLGQSLPQFQQCYQRALDRDPIMHGRMTFHFTIDARGAATKLASSSDLPDPNLRACIAKKVETVSFPTSGGTTDVTYGLGLTIQ